MLSGNHNYVPAQHLALGRALAPLRDEGVLIVGSGLSFHNMRGFGPQGKEASALLDGWLNDTMMSAPAARTAALLKWEQAPAARLCHPQEDHFIPQMAAVGAAEGETATRFYHDRKVAGYVTASSYRFD